MTRLNRLFVFVVVSFISACASLDHGHYAVLSPVEIDDFDNYVLLEKNVRGEDKSIYWALYAGRPPEVDEAVEDALSKSGGLFMKNVDVRWDTWIIPLVWGETTMEVEGEVWGKRESQSNSSTQYAPSGQGPR